MLSACRLRRRGLFLQKNKDFMKKIKKISKKARFVGHLLDIAIYNTIEKKFNTHFT